MPYQIRRIRDCYPNVVYYDGPSPEYTDPVMGSGALNCSFIAALSAVAWTTQGRLYIERSATAGNCNVRFSTAGGANDPYETSEELCLDCDPSLNLPFRCAYSSEWPGVQEVWPGLYEKAYAAKYLNLTACQCTQAGVWPGNADPPLTRLCGCVVRQAALNIDTIKGLCAGNDPVRKTRYPMVISTKTNAEFVNLNLLNKDQMKPDHSYTVLGTYRTNDVDYIVLRNPENLIYNNHTNANALVGGAWTQINNLYNCRTGLVVVNAPNTQVNFGTKGIFALRGNQLQTYFSRCSYAQG